MQIYTYKYMFLYMYAKVLTINSVLKIFKYVLLSMDYAMLM